MSILPGAPRRAFNNCEHKQIDLTHFRDKAIVTGAILSCPKTEDLGTPVTILASNIRGADRLYPHVSGSYYRNAADAETKFTYATSYDGREYAYKHMGRTAARTICNGCEYAKRTPEEVDDIQADALEGKLRVTEAALRKARALASLKTANAELAAIDTANGLTPLIELGSRSDIDATDPAAAGIMQATLGANGRAQVPITSS